MIYFINKKMVNFYYDIFFNLDNIIFNNMIRF